MAALAHTAAVAVAVGGAASAASNGGSNGCASSQAAGLSAKSSSLVMRLPPASFAPRLGVTSERASTPTFHTGASFQPIACSSSVSVDQAVVENNVGLTKLGGAPATDGKLPAETDDGQADTSSSKALISSFMADVTNLVKLVDSKDIVELELKFSEYEIVIRKAAAQQPAPPSQPSPPHTMTFPGPHVMAHTSLPMYAPPPPSLLPPTPANAETSVPAEAPAPAPVQPSHPPMLSPMAGTFYRSPGPGLNAFVQVGDKVTKGQVVCIVEAMKLMNEIEADQSGTLSEILAEDGKPISIEQPLFKIVP